MATYDLGNMDPWATKTIQRMTAVFRASAQRVGIEVKTPVGEGGRMRVLTGHLRRSLLASTSAMPTIDPTNSNPDQLVVPDDNQQVALVIAEAKLGQHVYLGFTASYAGYREYADGFVRLTAQRWPNIVSEECRKIRQSVEARG